MQLNCRLALALLTALLTGCAPMQPAPDLHLVPWLAANGRYGFVDDSGALRIPAQYENAHAFSHGLAAAYQDGHWGYVDTLGRWVVKPRYDQALDFNADGLGEMVTIKSPWNIGDSLLPIHLTKGYTGYTIFNTKGEAVKSGTIDASGPPDRDYRPAVAKAAPPPARPSAGAPRWTMGPQMATHEVADWLWGLKAADGRWIVPPRYKLMPEFHGGLARVTRACRAFYIDTTGKEYAADTQDWPKTPPASCERTEYYQCVQCRSYYLPK